MRAALAVLVGVIATVAVEAQTEVKTFTLATGEIHVFAFKGGIPEPSESGWAVSRGAGPAIAPEGKGYRLSWVVDLESKDGGATLANVSTVSLQEVSGKKPVNLYSGKPKHTEEGILIVAPDHLVTRFAYPWLYTQDRTILVFRVEMSRPGAKPDVLLQPVLIGREVKNQLKESGYLP